MLITGAAGQLGRALAAQATLRGCEVIACDRAALDIGDKDAILRVLARHRPDWVLHCAAATKVDRCESEVEAAERINGEAPGWVALACAELGAGLVHYSTDFVFDGRKTTPYVETDPIHPLSVYGRTKAAGEAAVASVGHKRALVLRTQWVYGPGGRCFPAAILERARSGQPLSVVDDQVGSPTMTLDLAAMSLDLCARHDAGEAAAGIYHAANDGIMTWYDFARTVLDRTGFEHVKIRRIDSLSLGLPAERPAYSALDTSKLSKALQRALPTVQDGLVRYLRASIECSSKGTEG